MKRGIILALVIGLFLFPSNMVFAANVDTYGIGAKATALGGAFAAYADDPYAVYYNPAGLTQIKDKVVSVGSMILNPNLKGKGFEVEKNGTVVLGPENFEDESPLLVVPHLGFVMPLNEKWTLAIASYVPFGLHLRWDDTANPFLNPASYDCYESWYMRMVVTPTVAYKVNDKLSVGFGVALGRGSAGTYLNSYPLFQNGITAREEVELTDDFNYSFNIGIMYKFTPKLTLGITYRSMADASFDGTLKLKDLSAAEQAALKAAVAAKGYTLTKFETDVSLDDVNYPRQVQVGLRYAPNEKVSMEVDVVWTNWSIVDKQTLQIKDPAFQALLGAKQDVIPRDWEDTKQVKVGIEWRPTRLLSLRCGYFYDPSPIPDHTFDNMWPDADKKTYSVGVGLNLKKWTIDTVLQYTVTEKDREIGGESEALNHAFRPNSQVSLRAEGEIWGAGITISYHF